MKKRLIPALSIGIVVILIGSLAYAADRKKKANTVGQATDKIHEEEALKAELLNALENYEQKPHDDVDTGKVAAVRSNDEKEQTQSEK
jgi:hypothetical protein